MKVYVLIKGISEIEERIVEIFKSRELATKERDRLEERDKFDGYEVLTYYVK